MESRIVVPTDPRARHRWLIRLLPPVTDEATGAFLSVLQEFASLGNGGAFVSPESDGTDCVMRIIEQRHAPAGVIDLSVEVQRCDARYARVLRNVVFATGEIVQTPPEEFRVEPAMDDLAARPLSPEVDAAATSAGTFYPGLSSRLGVHVQRTRPPDYRSGRRILLRCSSEVPSTLVHGLIDLVERWTSVLDCAYPSSEKELQDGDSTVLNVDGSQHDDFTFEIVVDKFIASEAAFSSLLNLLVIRASRDVHVVSAAVE